MKRAIVSVMICLLAVFTLAAAGNKENTAPAEEYRILTDDRGVEVRIKKNVETIATFPLPHPHIISAIDGGVDRIIGAHKMSVSAAQVSVFGKIAPGLLNVETGYLDGQTLNVEELVKVEPDVFFTDSVLAGMENLEQTGIPVIYLGLKKESIPYQGKDIEMFSPKKTMEDWVRLTAEVLGKNESLAGEIAQVWTETEQEIAGKLKNISDSQRPKVLILFQTKSLMVSGRGTFGDYWIARTGGLNAAAEAQGNHPAQVKIGNFEDVLKWNPDIIYLTNFEDTMPDDIYGNKLDGQDWSNVSAVKNRRVYRIPLGIYRWYPPSLDGPLMLKWMAQKNYPDLFDYDMEQEVKEYFARFHHYNVSPQEAKAILNPQASGNLF